MRLGTSQMTCYYGSHQNPSTDWLVPQTVNNDSINNHLISLSITHLVTVFSKSALAWLRFSTVSWVLCTMKHTYSALWVIPACGSAGMNKWYTKCWRASGSIARWACHTVHCTDINMMDYIWWARMHHMHTESHAEISVLETQWWSCQEFVWWSYHNENHDEVMMKSRWSHNEVTMKSSWSHG